MSTTKECPFSLRRLLLKEAKAPVEEMLTMATDMKKIHEVLLTMNACTSCSQFNEQWKQILNVRDEEIPKSFKKHLDKCSIIVDAFSRLALWLIGSMTQKHFQLLFPKCRIELGRKLNGVTLGCTVRVSPSDSKEEHDSMLHDSVSISDEWCKEVCVQILSKCEMQSVMQPIPKEHGLYYVKIHGSGMSKASTGMLADCDVNAEELIAYKLLEGLQLGPPVHFFSIGESLVLIASRSVQSYDNSKVLAKEFYNSNQGVYMQSLVSNNAYNQFEQVGSGLIYSITSVDLVCRLIGLSDILNNDGNYFISNCSQEIAVVDFMHVGARSIYFVPGFVTGISHINYKQHNNPIVAYICCSRPLHLRIETALQVFIDLEYRLPAAKIAALKVLPIHEELLNLVCDEFHALILTARTKLAARLSVTSENNK